MATELLLLQKSRAEWIEYGDRSTKYFHLVLYDVLVIPKYSKNIISIVSLQASKYFHVQFIDDEFVTPSILATLQASHSLDYQSPFLTLHGSLPDLSYLRVFASFAMPPITLLTTQNSILVLANMCMLDTL